MKHWWNQVVELQLFLPRVIIILVTHSIENGNLWALQPANVAAARWALTLMDLMLVLCVLPTNIWKNVYWAQQLLQLGTWQFFSTRSSQYLPQKHSAVLALQLTSACRKFLKELYNLLLSLAGWALWQSCFRKVLLAFQSCCAGKCQSGRWLPERRIQIKEELDPFAPACFRFMDLELLIFISLGWTSKLPLEEGTAKTWISGLQLCTPQGNPELGLSNSWRAHADPETSLELPAVC